MITTIFTIIIITTMIVHTIPITRRTLATTTPQTKKIHSGAIIIEMTWYSSSSICRKNLATVHPWHHLPRYRKNLPAPPGTPRLSRNTSHRDTDPSILAAFITSEKHGWMPSIGNALGLFQTRPGSDPYLFASQPPRARLEPMLLGLPKVDWVTGSRISTMKTCMFGTSKHVKVTTKNAKKNAFKLNNHVWHSKHNVLHSKPSSLKNVFIKQPCLAFKTQVWISNPSSLNFVLH